MTDTSGGVLPGATVTVENTGTKDVRTAVTQRHRRLRVHAAADRHLYGEDRTPGLLSRRTRSVTLTSGDRIRVDGQLARRQPQRDGAGHRRIAAAPDRRSRRCSSLVTEKAVQDLPVNGRNFMHLVQLVPGATEGARQLAQQRHASRRSPVRPRRCRSTARADNQNNQMIDGMDNNERAIGTVGVKPSMDAIAEVRVQTNLYLGRDRAAPAAAIINILTKSGTNAFHGSAYEFYRNDRFDERDYFATVDPILEPEPVRRQLRRADRLEPDVLLRRLRAVPQREGAGQQPDAADAKMRTGDFSEMLALRRRFRSTTRSTSPRTPFPNNRFRPTGSSRSPRAICRSSRRRRPADWPTTTRARRWALSTATRWTSASITGSTRTTRSSCATRTTTSTTITPGGCPVRSGHRDLARAV